MKKLIAAALAPLAVVAAPAHAASFFSTFENVAGGPTAGNYTIVSSADGWTGGAGGIELQNNVAGAPAANGGSVSVELDPTANSSMFRTIADAGTYTLSYLYSARPGVASTSNGIEVLLNGTLLTPGLVTGEGGAATAWRTITSSFTATAGSTLTFRAAGTSDGLGGYVDNIAVTAVPEPATWAMMMVGFALVGLGMRARNRRPARVVYA